MRVVGDIHGEVRTYKRALGDATESLQLGDYGIFMPPDIDRLDAGPGHHFIRGNHDHPQLVKEAPGYVESGPWNGDWFVVGGGWSIDKAWRTPGYDWWPEEEHSEEELIQLVNEYVKRKPRIVVSHEGPPRAIEAMFSPKPYKPSRTSLTLGVMSNLHQPDLWIFGHWHQRAQFENFICLGIGDHIDVD